MWPYLAEANEDLLYQVEVLQELMGETKVAGELTPYLAQVALLCEQLRQQALRNLKDVGYAVDGTQIDVLAATQNVTRLFELLNTRLASPITRARPGDRLGLLVLRFLHDGHPMGRKLPFGLTDGMFAVYPTSQVPPIYLVPVTRQNTLLYLPLLFHEFGHVLYALQKPELDDLVKDFQGVVSKALAPKTVRNPTGAGRPDRFRRDLVTAWYAWVQEFFCDAVGLTTGGPAFLKSFSHFFRTLSRDQYYVPRDKQLERKHPVSWLRARMLSDRARGLGFGGLADAVDSAWSETARTMGVTEDYEGTWLDEFFLPLRKSLDDMLEESQPYRHTAPDLAPADAKGPLNPVHLCNLAWSEFEADPRAYRSWERTTIVEYLRRN